MSQRLTITRTTAARALTLLGAGALLAVATDLVAQPGGEMPPTPVETTTPQLENLSEIVSTVGSLRAAESVTLRPEFPGRIEKVHFEEGQTVKDGAPLFSLDASLVRAEVREWDAVVAQSRRETQRAGELVERKLAAQNDLDSKRAELAVNEARLSSAKTRLAKSVIHAPFAGAVGLRQVSPGEYVEVGDALVSLAQLDPIKLDFRMPESFAGRLAVGLAFTLQVEAFPGQTFSGAVSAIDPQLDAAGRSVVLRGTLPNADGRLRPGLFARISLNLGQRDKVMMLPEQALWPLGAKQFVFIVKDGKADLVEVQTGVRRDGKVEIVSGIGAETVVVTAGQIKIGPGAPVQAVPMKGAPAATPAVPTSK